LLKDYAAPINPLTVITPIVDKKPRIDIISKVGAFNLQELTGTPFEEPGAMIDYLQSYEKDGFFDTPRLIDDDYFLAIKLLFNAKHYVSASKLLMSCIDTISFIDAGDIPGGFAKWLDTYADLGPLGITSKELWEFRNSVLHMTNLSSRAVLSGKTAPLIFYVGNSTHSIPPSPSGAKYFSLKGLLDAIAAALLKWIASYNEKPEKFVDFVRRYDLTISDSRIARISVGTNGSETSGGAG
jgi:hypothetical protein